MARWRGCLGAAAVLAALAPGCIPDRPTAGDSAIDGGPAATEDGPMTVAYGDHPAQVADLYLPAGGQPVPVVVLLHGGFWLERYTRELMAPLAADLVGRGYAVWNVEYRRVGGDGGYPQTLADVAAAVDHLAVLDDPRLDLERVTAVGHSAGGQLAFWLAARDQLAPDAPGADPEVTPVAVAGQAAVVDLVAAAEQDLGGGAVRELLGGGPEEVPDAYAVADPSQRVPLGVPQLLVHGTSDGLVPFDQSQNYAERARRAGDDITLRSVDGGHFVHLDPASDAWQTVVDWLAP